MGLSSNMMKQGTSQINCLPETSFYNFSINPGKGPRGSIPIALRKTLQIYNGNSEMEVFNDNNKMDPVQVANVAVVALDDNNNNQTSATLNAFSKDQEETIDHICDGIASVNVSQSYIGDTSNFLQWVVINENSWLTEYGSSQIANVLAIDVRVKMLVNIILESLLN